MFHDARREIVARNGVSPALPPVTKRRIGFIIDDE
jgi:hypothetical protein